MSKIGKINISIPEKVKVALAGNIINIEGPLGKKSINIREEIVLPLLTIQQFALMKMREKKKIKDMTFKEFVVAMQKSQRLKAKVGKVKVKTGG